MKDFTEQIDAKEIEEKIMLQLKNIVKHYTAGDTTVKALKGISIDFKESEFVSILGPSGCGKTTLLNIVGGLDRYTSGDLIINGKSTKQYKSSDWDTYRNHSIGFVFQNYNLISHLSIVGNVELALSLSGVSKKDRHNKALAVLKEVGLKDQANKRPNQLSGGQMQRVAIARALVNDPDIILADEPTGALDSKTSIQVLNLLKKISDKKLIIMVTHNADLAKKYSDRIISMKDGEIINDNNPYQYVRNAEDNETEEHKSEQVETKPKSKGKKEKKNGLGFFKKKKSSMSYGTALSLSGKNLLSKKGRTFMTSFAGSIGIIGIALVLAISNGLTSYTNKMQSDALGSYPITVSAISVDMNKFTSMEFGRDDAENVDEDVVIPYNPMQQFIQYGHYNNITSAFIDHVKQFESTESDKGSKSNINTIEYNYYTPLKILSKTANNTIVFYNNKNETSILSGSPSQTFYPLLDNTDFVMDSYDLIYGEMPQQAEGLDYSTEMLLVVGKGNKLSIQTLQALGITTSTDSEGNYNKINFEDICSKEFKLLYNDDYYIPDSSNFDDITSFGKLSTSQSSLTTAYNNASTTLKISGVIRVKDNAPSELLSAGIAYMPSLSTHYLDNCSDSVIARKQLANKSSYTFYDNYVLSISEMSSILPADGFGTVEEINMFLMSAYGYSLSQDDAFNLAMQQIGISTIPVSIAFYPKNFAAKDSIVEMIDAYNNKQTNKNLEIVYSDTTQFLTSTLGNVISIISYVLIAFASISLIVSSVMIGVLTYASVIERTKEIGVLRSIGARKKDISRVFNSETLIIGFSAGVIGVAISYLFCPIINAIVSSVAGDSITGSIAILNPLHALLLVVISTCLTFISGLIPARIAAKKDPVKALRTE